MLRAVAALSVAGAVGWGLLWHQQSEQMRFQHYQNGLWATESRQWDQAVTEFQAAGNFRDAPEKLEQAEASLAEVEERLATARVALTEGRSWDAAFLLRQAAAAMPEHAEARLLLALARERAGQIVLVRHDPTLPRGEATSVVLTSADLGAVRPLRSGLAGVERVQFSPDGAWLLYEALDVGRITLWLVNVASGEQEILVRAAPHVAAEWSSDGQFLLVAWEGETGWALEWLRPGTPERERLSEGTEFVAAAFAPRGPRFTRWEQQGDRWTLTLGAAGRTDLRPLVEGSLGRGQVAWSNDGATLAYSTYDGEHWRLAQLAPDEGTPPEPLATADEMWLAFRPQQSGYIFWQGQEKGGSALVLQTDAAYPLLRDVDQSWGRWSDDGRWFVAGTWNEGAWRLWLWQVPEAGIPAAPTLLTQDAQEVDGSFDPTSQRLLVRQWRDKQWSLGIHDLATGESRPLLVNVGDAQAHWTPDGKSLLLWSSAQGASGAGQVEIADAATGRRRPLLADVRTLQGTFARDGSKLAFAAQRTDGTTSTWVADPNGENLLEWERRSYRIYAASAPFVLGSVAPVPR